MDLSTDQRGVLVAEVVDGSPASQAGLRGSDRQVELDGGQMQAGGDVIVGIDDQPVREFDDLVTYLARSTSVGDTVTLTLLRDGQERTVEVTLTARPQEEPQQAQVQPRREGTGSAWLGIRGLTVMPEIAESMDLDAGQDGVLVAEVVQGSPADEAGLREGSETLELDGASINVGGDIIVAADGENVRGMEDLLAILQRAEPGQEITLTLLRDGREVTAEVTLVERPASLP
jgi:S1-C subfamily serine protease